MRYQFIQKHQGQFRITILLRVLAVSPSAFYQWQNRPESVRARQKKQLKAQVCELFNQSKGRYGSPRIHRDLQALGIKCSQKRVARLMKEQHLWVRKPRRFVATTEIYTDANTLSLHDALPIWLLRSRTTATYNHPCAVGI